MKQAASIYLAGVLILAPATEALAKRNCEQLELFELSELSYIGEQVVDGVPKAVVIGPDNKKYTAKVGNYAGKDYGMITKITDDYIELHEMLEAHGDSTSTEWLETVNYLARDNSPKSKYKTIKRGGYRGCVYDSVLKPLW